MIESASPQAMSVPVRVMLVDDSSIVRNLIARSLTSQSGINIVAMASNGVEAIPMAAEYKPDVIVLDIEMPEMDGITALPKLLEVSPRTRVVMASTLTQRNAAISIKALSLGACDYVPKPTAMGSGTELTEFYRQLNEKIQALGSSGNVALPIKRVVPPQNNTPIKAEAIAIASSTGGPQALLTVLEGIKGKFLHIPIFITQHMPPMFTTLLADHLAKSSGRPCREAKDGEVAQGGHIYLAPGDFHMVAERQGNTVIVRTNQNPLENFCRPAADPMLRALSAVYKNNLLVLVLTGMGSDGAEGCKVVTEAGGTIIAQDASTSVVWGMPRAVAEKGLCRAVLPLPEIAPYVIGAVQHAS